MSKSRGWCFTLNNYTEDQYNSILRIQCNYLIVGKEKGELGTPHLQGYLHFKNPRYFNGVKALLPNECHIEPAKGSPKQNHDYCSKDGDFIEIGTLPQQGKRTDLEKIAQDLSTKSIEEVTEENPGFALLHLKAMRSFKHELQYIKTTWNEFKPKTVLWFYGETGSGKTRTAMEISRGRKFWVWNGSLQWFDGINAECTLAILDDFRAIKGEFNLLLRLLDGYPVSVPTKGGFTIWNPEMVIITTPYDIKSTYQFLDENVDQLLRRVTEQRNFTNTSHLINIIN